MAVKTTRRKKRDEKWFVSATYSASPPVNREFDDEFEKIARSCGGKLGGSGFCFMDSARDIDVYFPTENKARKFAVRIRKMRRIGVRIKVFKSFWETT